VGEKLPFQDDEFDFVNMSEVIEHVEDPKKVMSEVYRVLKPGGKVYVSVPNRFGFYDQHFHIYFVNWLPRRWSDTFISIFGKHKDYSGKAGRQRLGEMHYYSWGGICSLVTGLGLAYEDIRLRKVKRMSVFFLPTYIVLRKLFFNAFHLMLNKSS